MPIGPSTRKGLLVAAYSLLILVGLALVYLGLRGTLPTIADVVLPIAYVGAILFLVRYQMRAFPTEHPRFSFRVGLRLRYLVKSVLCFVIAFFWTAIVASITGETPIGNLLAVGPSLVVVFLGAYFFIRGFPNSFRQ